MNQYLKNHQLNKAEIGVTDESISDWISGLQDTFSSTQNFVKQPHLQRSKSPDKSFIYFGTPFRFKWQYFHFFHIILISWLHPISCTVLNNNYLDRIFIPRPLGRFKEKSFISQIELKLINWWMGSKLGDRRLMNNVKLRRSRSGLNHLFYIFYFQDIEAYFRVTPHFTQHLITQQYEFRS